MHINYFSYFQNKKKVIICSFFYTINENLTSKEIINRNYKKNSLKTDFKKKTTVI